MGFTKTETKDLKELGQRLRAARKAKGISLIELGYRIDREHQSISRIERGETNPTYLYLIDICRALEISLAELINIE